MDGYEPGTKQSLPQVERRLSIQPERITAFRRGPHSDEDLTAKAAEIAETGK